MWEDKADTPNSAAKSLYESAVSPELPHKISEEDWRSVIGEGIHTGFRKGTDHPQAHDYWKLIEGIPDKLWTTYSPGLFPVSSTWASSSLETAMTKRQQMHHESGKANWRSVMLPRWRRCSSGKETRISLRCTLSPDRSPIRQARMH